MSNAPKAGSFRGARRGNLRKSRSAKPQNLDEKRAEKQFKDYFNILSFSELINESTDIIKELNNNPISNEVTMKSKILLSQFSKRLGDESKDVAETFQDMRKRIEAKILDLNNRL